MTDPILPWNQHGDTLGALLLRREAETGDRPFVHLLEDGGGETLITFAAMAEDARRAAAALQARGVRPGDRVLLVLPTGREFLAAFFGTLLAGAVAVPCYPPARSKGLTDYQTRLARLVEAAAPAIVVTFKRVRLVVEAAAFEARSGAPVVDGGDLAGDAAAFRPAAVGPDDMALVQFSSGSTRHPKGVALNHRHLLANVASVLSVIRPTPEDVNCSWLPLYHDMGLIGGLLMPLFCGNPLVLMSPQGFLLDPKRWLWAIHRHRATISTAPNFAYQLLATRLDDAELAGLDLSSWRLALNGAEPISPATVEAFCARMAPYGFRADAMTPVYGLAEAALGAVFPTLGGGARFDRIDQLALSSEGRAVPESQAEAPVVAAYASVGQALPGFALRIAGPDGAEAPERSVGEIQLRGPSIMAGYLDDAAATAEAIRDGWLRTGDLGYVADGELYVVGRVKDLILKGGRNYVPQDLERAAEEVPGVRRGCVAAFGVPDPETGTERVVVVAESRAEAHEHEALARRVQARTLEAMGLQPDLVAIVPPGTVPKTSSGKLQRSRCRELWLSGALKPLAEPGAWEKTRVVGQAVAQRLVARTRRHG